MRKGSSGLMFAKNKDGSITVEVVDYGVSEFAGGDWESRYDLDEENAAILYQELKKLHTGTFKTMMLSEFGEEFDTCHFEEFCGERNIKFSHSTWS